MDNFVISYRIYFQYSSTGETVRDTMSMRKVAPNRKSGRIEAKPFTLSSFPLSSPAF